MLKTIEKNRQLFVSYNIFRLRQLIRYLSEEKFELFQLIPFYLHVNLPEYPGYIESEDFFYGIYKFQDSGFFKYTRARYHLSASENCEVFHDLSVIQGLYLMGSAGTLTQSEKSDFDYWVVIDRATLTDKQYDLLSDKVRRIERWCFEKYHQEVTFFIMDIEQLRQNDFSAVDNESSGSAQKTLLKEEFYRTFIMLAGKIPLWAVLPAGASDITYEKLRVTEAVKAGDYIDTGNLSSIEPGECLGAVLWQVYKAKNDPVKSLIKATLIAYYFFNTTSGGPVCNIIREKFSENKTEAHLFDPYTIVFEKVILFYNELDDLSGLHLIRQCIFLRLLGYPQTVLPDLKSPKGKLLIQLAKDWGYSLEKLDHLKKFHLWREKEKLDFEGRVFDRLSFLYELILRSTDNPVQIIMEKKDLDVLVNRTAAFRQKATGKIDRASTFLRRYDKTLLFLLKETVTEEADECWDVYATEPQIKGKQNQLVYTGNTFMEVAGWLIVNQFVSQDFSNVKIEIDSEAEHFSSPVKSLNRIFDFFGQYLAQRPDYVYKDERKNERIFIFPGTDNGLGTGRLHFSDYLLANSWGELYCGRIELSFLERTPQKCYKIAETIFHLQQENSGNHFEYLICTPDHMENRSLPDVIENLIDKLKKDSEKTGADAIKNTPMELSEKKHKPFLDTL